MSFVFFAIESALTYREELARFDQELFQIRQSHIPSLISSLWLMDYGLLQQQIDAIARFPYIDRVEVEDDEGRVLSAGNSEKQGLEVHSETLTYTRRELQAEIGELRIFINQQRLNREVIGEQSLYVFGHILITLVVTLAVLLLFHNEIAKHLKRLSKDLHEGTNEALDSPIILRRKIDHPDELHSLIFAINQMRRNLHAHLKERELLVSEVHHRIKNDMGFVKALLFLQAEQSGSPEVKTAVQEASQRVSVMARIYERLYGDGNFIEVGLKPLAENVIADLRALSGLQPGSVELVVEDLKVRTKLSVAIGIILNELVTNSLKYAPETTEDLRIVVRICLDALGSSLEMTVSDNGAGIPEDVISGARRGYGLTVVGALVDQHNGTLKLCNDQGAVVSLVFPLGRKQDPAGLV